jgi:hypothetical protein
MKPNNYWLQKMAKAGCFKMIYGRTVILLRSMM